MVITNRMELPQAIVNACSTEKHNKENCVSATTLLHGVKSYLLSERHWDELEDDAADRIWAVFGTAVHSLLETQTTSGFKEESFEVQVGSKVVTGKVDLYDLEKEEIDDYKTASVWKVMFKDFEDWRKQGLIYAWLLSKKGLSVKKCRFIAMLKDHSKTKAKTDANYPKSPVYIYEFDVTKESLDEIEKFIEDKVSQIEKFENLPDDEIPPCTSEERWESKTTYAVKKPGRKTAVKVFDSREEAGIMATNIGGYVETRAGECKKCNEYCSCCEFCHFYKELNKAKEEIA